MRQPAGVIYVATGERFVRQARDAGRSLRAAMPGLPADLFTDAPQPALERVQGGPFDRVHVLEDPWIRSKIDAMLLSRFERTFYLDADTRVVAEFPEVFDLLDRFDLALAQDPLRNSPESHVIWREAPPAAWPQFNGGAVAFRRTPQVRAFLEAWKAAVRAHGIGRDQPSLRELLWESDLRVAVLPEEYNLLDWPTSRVWGDTKAAPRILHLLQMRHRDNLEDRPWDEVLADILGPRVRRRMEALLAGDRTLAARRGEAPVFPDPRRRRREAAAIVAAAGLRRLRRLLRRGR